MPKGDVIPATLRVVAEIETASTPLEVGQRLVEYASHFGLTALVMMTLPRSASMLGADGVLIAHPSDIATDLVDNPKLLSDKLIKELYSTSAAVTWETDTFWQDAAAGQHLVRDALMKHNMRSGIAVPALGSAGLTGIILLAGTAPVFDNPEAGFLIPLSVHGFDRACARQQEALREQYGLSVREFECMKWVAAGKTDWEIGQILDISPKTVNYHVENAKRKMLVQTRVQAVVAAILAGGVQP